jgi:hypothetical protein
MMDKPARATLIVNSIISLDEKYGRPIPPRSPRSTCRTRQVSDDPRWEARWSIAYEKGEDGEFWDLIELSVYGQPRMTAVKRGDEVVPRFYIPGKWEPIFLPFDTNDTVPLLPN